MDVRRDDRYATLREVVVGPTAWPAAQHRVNGVEVPEDADPAGAEMRERASARRSHRRTSCARSPSSTFRCPWRATRRDTRTRMRRRTVRRARGVPDLRTVVSSRLRHASRTRRVRASQMRQHASGPWHKGLRQIDVDAACASRPARRPQSPRGPDVPEPAGVPGSPDHRGGSSRPPRAPAECGIDSWPARFKEWRWSARLPCGWNHDAAAEHDEVAAEQRPRRLVPEAHVSGARPGVKTTFGDRRRW